MRILPGLAYNDMKRILAGFSSMAGKNAWPLPGFFLSGLSDVSRGEYPGRCPGVLLDKRRRHTV